MKLFRVNLIDDTESYTDIVVARSAEEAERKVSEMNCWSCLIYVDATEIKYVDGFKVKLEKYII